LLGCSLSARGAQLEELFRMSYYLHIRIFDPKNQLTPPYGGDCDIAATKNKQCCYGFHCQDNKCVQCKSNDDHICEV